jgi:transcriptional regulator with XRE-family HTH domain
MNQQRTDRDDLVIALDGNKLARACAVRGWSFAQLARQARISRPTMTAAVRGRTLRPRTAWKIAKALGEASTAPELTDLVRKD